LVKYNDPILRKTIKNTYVVSLTKHCFELKSNNRKITKTIEICLI